MKPLPLTSAILSGVSVALVLLVLLNQRKRRIVSSAPASLLVRERESSIARPGKTIKP